VFKFSTNNPVGSSSWAAIKIISVIFVTFAFIGCGGSSSGSGGGGGGGDGSANGTGFTVSIYDRYLNLNKTVVGEVIDLSKVGISPLYEAKSYVDISNRTDFNVTADTNLYGVLNVTEIVNQAGLDNIRNNLEGAYILLDNVNINSTDAGVNATSGWIPIGSNDVPFKGVFSGNGYTIYGLWSNSSLPLGTGLFGYARGAHIKNVGVVLDDAKGGIKGQGNVGGIVGYASGGSLSNVRVSGNVNGANNITGGIAGYISYAGVINADYSGNVSGTIVVGGIAGRLDTEGIVIDSHSKGNVNAVDGSAGGIAGHIQGGNITNSYSTGDVISGKNQAGGIAGYMLNATVSKTYAAGNIKGNSSVGGIVGHSDAPATVTHNAAVNYFITSPAANRIIGSFQNGTNDIQNNFALSTMAGNFTNAQNATYHGVDRSESALKEKVTYSGPAMGDGSGGLGWSFGNSSVSPWTMPAIINYPKLYWEK
jgi:hypothetical protein